MARVIFVPNMKGGFLDFWQVVPDDGRELRFGEIRKEIDKDTNWVKLEDLLAYKKKTYLLDMEQMRKDWKARQVVTHKDERYWRLMNGCRKVMRKRQEYTTVLFD